MKDTWIDITGAKPTFINIHFIKLKILLKQIIKIIIKFAIKIKIKFYPYHNESRAIQLEITFYIANLSKFKH